MNADEQAELIKAVAQFVKERTDPLCDRIAQLEQRLADFGYVGEWQEATEYKHGNFCSLGGSMWHAERDTTARPTTEHPDWRLAVKRGRDGPRTQSHR